MVMDPQPDLFVSTWSGLVRHHLSMSISEKLTSKTDNCRIASRAGRITLRKDLPMKLVNFYAKDGIHAGLVRQAHLHWLELPQTR